MQTRWKDCPITLKGAKRPGPLADGAEFDEEGPLPDVARPIGPPALAHDRDELAVEAIAVGKLLQEQVQETPRRMVAGGREFAHAISAFSSARPRAGLGSIDCPGSHP